MATIKSVVSKHGTGYQKTNLDQRHVTSLQISFELTPEEAQILPSPRKLAGIFGPDGRDYASMVRRSGGELHVRYMMSKQPFGSSDHELIPELALAHIQSVLESLQSSASSQSSLKTKEP